MAERQRKKHNKRLTCPKCRRVQWVVCGDRECECFKKIPKHLKPQQWTRNGESCRCPYCRFVAHVDYWFHREWKLVRESLVMALSRDTVKQRSKARQ